jgi:hypothetical protein
MTKQKSTKPIKDPKAQPYFQPALHLGSGAPFIVTDSNGGVWRLDPESGVARKVRFEF